MSSAVVSKRLINRGEYHIIGETGLLQPDENVELINGEIYNMAPIGSKHFAVVNKLNALFVPAFINDYQDHANEPRSIVDELSGIIKLDKDLDHKEMYAKYIE